MAVQPGDPARGVLDFSKALTAFRLHRTPPSSLLTSWVENYWEVLWDLPPGKAHRQTNLSHAAFNVAIEPEGAWLYGVPGPTFVREITGAGRVFGVKFHPGAFFPWYKKPLKSLYDRRVPLADVLGPEWQNWAEAIRAETALENQVALADRFLEERRPDPPTEGCRIASRMMTDRSLIRVDDVCQVLGIDLRSLQRLFYREVGVAPKEVLKRYRLMEAAERLARVAEVSGADLALSLGYSDQAHFIHDFKAVTGVPPEAYRRRQNPPVTDPYSAD